MYVRTSRPRTKLLISISYRLIILFRTTRVRINTRRNSRGMERAVRQCPVKRTSLTFARQPRYYACKSPVKNNNRYPPHRPAMYYRTTVFALIYDFSKNTESLAVHSPRFEMISWYFSRDDQLFIFVQLKHFKTRKLTGFFMYPYAYL